MITNKVCISCPLWSHVKLLVTISAYIFRRLKRRASCCLFSSCFLYFCLGRMNDCVTIFVLIFHFLLLHYSSYSLPLCTDLSIYTLSLSHLLVCIYDICFCVTYVFAELPLFGLNLYRGTSHSKGTSGLLSELQWKCVLWLIQRPEAAEAISCNEYIWSWLCCSHEINTLCSKTLSALLYSVQ